MEWNFSKIPKQRVYEALLLLDKTSSKINLASKGIDLGHFHPDVVAQAKASAGAAAFDQVFFLKT